jgi:hypothetical protein
MSPMVVGRCDKLSVVEWLERGLIIQIANETSKRVYAKPLRKLNLDNSECIQECDWDPSPLAL